MKYLFSIVLISLILFACSQKLSEKEYYSQAEKAYSEQNFEEAVKNYKGLVENYPNSENNSKALFMLGFILANDLKQYDEAKKYYVEFTTKYPKHELADDALYEIETLGKDINELPMFKNVGKDSLKESSIN
jgi:outer membrane protein assembly factor BamD (BamD/ComL family)